MNLTCWLAGHQWLWPVPEGRLLRSTCAVCGKEKTLDFGPGMKLPAIKRLKVTRQRVKKQPAAVLTMKGRR